MRRSMLATAVVLVMFVVLTAPVAAAAPGDHAWFGSVYSTGGVGDESAVAVATDAAGFPIVVGDAVTAAAGDLDIRWASWTLAGDVRWTSVEGFWDYPANPGARD